MSKLLSEIRRRQVLQTFVPYLGFLWLILQIVSVVTPMLNWPPLVSTFVAVLLFAGLPVFLFLSWHFNISLKGLEYIPEAGSDEAKSFGLINWSFLVLITISSGFLSFKYFSTIEIEYFKKQDGLQQTVKASSIAVLPFKDSSPDQDQAFLAQGLAEEITSLLGRTQDLSVAASSSTAILNDKGLDPVSIARRLNVDTILTGSVRKTGDKLTVRTELISAIDGKVIWTESFARKFIDIFAVETEIARSAVNLLQDTYLESGSLENTASTSSTDAYVIYLKGREQYRKQTTESMKQARKLFEQAIGLDPEYAQAYVALADTIVLLAEGPERFGVLKVEIAAILAKQNLEKAIVRQPDIAHAYAVLGYVARLNQQVDLALSNFNKAIELNPNLSIAYTWRYRLLSTLNRQNEALEDAKFAAKLDPVSLVTQYNLGFEFALRNRNDESKVIYESLIEFHPNSPLGYAGLADLAFGVGNYAKSLENWILASKTQQAIIHTKLGDIKIELYTERAPATVANFIRYIEEDAFKLGRFYRVVRLDNDNGSPKIEVIQGGANPDFKDFTPIPLESTKQSGIKHLDGTLSMARGAPNSATSMFFICVGPQPSLDFGGMRNPDGQGFAVFGKVIEGMHIVKKIHQIKETLKVEDEYIQDQILAKPVQILNIELIP